MEFKTKQELLQLKKMALSFMMVCQRMEREALAGIGRTPSLFYASQTEESELIIKQIETELKQFIQ